MAAITDGNLHLGYENCLVIFLLDDSTGALIFFPQLNMFAICSGFDVKNVFFTDKEYKFQLSVMKIPFWSDSTCNRRLGLKYRSTNKGVKI